MHRLLFSKLSAAMLMQSRQLLDRLAQLLDSDLAAHVACHSCHGVWPQVQILYAHRVYPVS